MAKRSTSTTKIISIVLVVAGIGLLYWAYQQSGSYNAQLTQAFTGAYTDKVMTLYIAGAASFFVGLYLFFRK